MHRGEEECRACSDFQSFMRQRRLAAQQQQTGQSKSQLNSTQQQEQANKNNSTESVTRSNDVFSTANQRECPLDRDELGNRTWSFLHTMTVYYPKQPNLEQQNQMSQFFTLFGKFYPCTHCAEDFRRDIQQHPPQTESRQKLSQWLCQVHNITNKKLGKPEFDCSKVLERWRDGWKDGRCDDLS